MKRFYKIWLVAFVVKAILATWLPLSNDEAYYWVWGHHPQWSYFDHPPFVGWLFSLGTLFESFGQAARLPGVFLGHCTLLFWNQILKPFLGERQREFWLVFVLFSPFLGLGSLVITPDVPFLFFWSASLFLLLKTLERPSWQNHALLGASLGLGFCSKYLIVLFVPCTLVWLVVSGNWRKVRWPGIALTIVMGLIFCFPVLYWNATHDWASFAFQLNHGLATKEPPTESLKWFKQYVLDQSLLLFPLVIGLALFKRSPRGTSFLHVFGWLPLGFFLMTSTRARVEANWPIMSHPEILSLAFINAVAVSRSVWPRRVLLLNWGLWILATLVVVSEILHPWVPVDRRKLKTSEFTKYDELLPEMDPKKEFYLGSYQMAASISYKLQRQIYKLDGMNRRDSYDFMPQSHPKGDSFFVGAEYWQPMPEWVEREGYQVISSRRLKGDLEIREVSRRAQDSNR